jgi:indolepyruvate ferredoxin oxidoreductase beta subunit
MRFDLMLTGVGGEGVLTMQVFIARAANLDGYHVRGVQLHGLAQRGGAIPTFVRFGSEDEVSSPGIMQANADLIIAFEALEAVRAAYYARKEKTNFVINDYPLVPIYSNLSKIPYPTTDEIVKLLKAFAKNIHVFKASQFSKEKLDSVILGNTMLIGIVTGMQLLPIKEDSLREAIKVTAPRYVETNIKAFQLGLQLGREKLKS